MPTIRQCELLNKHIGGCRFIYNLALETKMMAYSGSKINLSAFDLMKQLSHLKQDNSWLKEINAQSLQQSIANMDLSFNNFFKGKSEFPKFKKKNSKQSFNIPQALYIKGDKISFPKFREGISAILHRSVPGKIKQATISRTNTNKYFISILCDVNDDSPIKKQISFNYTVGVDLGIKTLIVTSDGKLFDNPKFLKKSLSKLKYIQRKLSVHKGKRTKHKLALIHEKITNQRKNFLHKTSIELIKSHDSIVIEDLNIKGMIKNHSLSQSVSDASWGELIRQLEYKAEWHGNNIIQINRFYPSSKSCSNCGFINQKLTLVDREWVCLSCGSLHDRDINAAINIKNMGLRNIDLKSERTANVS